MPSGRITAGKRVAGSKRHISRRVMDMYFSFCNSQSHRSVNSTKCCREAPRHRDKESLACRHLSRGAICAKLFLFRVVAVALLTPPWMRGRQRDRNQHEYTPDSAAGGGEGCGAFSRSPSFARIDDSLRWRADQRIRFTPAMAALVWRNQDRQP